VDRVSRLLDFRGCASRGEYWVITVCGNIAVSVMNFTAGLIGGGAMWVNFVPLITFLLILPIQVAVVVRRLHDRGKSGWWAMLFLGFPLIAAVLAPILGLGGSLRAPVFLVLALVFIGLIGWAFVELGVLPAKQGRNPYAAPHGRHAEVFD
jgi:uncharacterized membrane protein YhaH (DUF805 family)